MREEMVSEGLNPPPPRAKRWDHNVITPGTQFMAKLADYLRCFVKSRLSDRQGAWKGLAVILSDATVPGEGEHKLVEHIRNSRYL
jgi:5'-3' exoribonuclease 2